MESSAQVWGRREFQRSGAAQERKALVHGEVDVWLCAAQEKKALLHGEVDDW